MSEVDNTAINLGDIYEPIHVVIENGKIIPYAHDPKTDPYWELLKSKYLNKPKEL